MGENVKYKGENYSETPEGTEHWKAIIDLLKHVTTLSAAICILVLAANRSVEIDAPKFWLISSVIFLLCSALGSLAAHVIYVATYRRGLRNRSDRDTAGRGLALSAFCFAAGLSTALIYFLIGATYA